MCIRDRAKAAQGEVKVARGKLEVQVEAAIKAITADGKTVLEEALSLPAPDDRAACERELADLARQINNLGPVNQVAFEEYERLRELADYVATQLADLESARTSLCLLYTSLPRFRVRSRFRSTVTSRRALSSIGPLRVRV